MTNARKPQCGWESAMGGFLRRQEEEEALIREVEDAMGDPLVPLIDIDPTSPPMTLTFKWTVKT